MNVLRRTLALTAACLLFGVALAAVGRRGDANIGAGLLGFGLLMASAGLWAALDGSRWPYPRVAITWVSVAALFGVLIPVLVAVAERGTSMRVLRSDLLSVGPFIAVLVAGSALVGGLVGTAFGHRGGRGYAGSSIDGHH